MALAGGENLGARLPGRYPRAELGEFMALAPAVILLPDEPYPFGASDLAAFAEYPTVPAVSRGRIHLLPGNLLFWPGFRALEGLALLRRLFLGLPAASVKHQVLPPAVP